MNNGREHEFRLPRFSLLLLGLLGAGGVGLVPRESWWLYAIVGGTLAYMAWRFHGLIGATVVVAFVLVHLQAATVIDEPLATSCFLFAWAGGLMAWSVAERRGRGAWVWPIALLVGSIVAFLVQQSRVLNEVEIRLLQASVGLWLFIGLGGLVLAPRIGGWQTFVLTGSFVAGPLTILVGLHHAGLLNKPVLDVTLWAGHGREWWAWAKDVAFNNEPWCWASAWVVAPLLILGGWRAWARGRQQWRHGDVPLGWLFGVGLLFGVWASLPDEVLLLQLEAIIVPVFGVIDLGVALVERIQLAPPAD